MHEYGKSLNRAGEILIKTIWFEKRLVDLIILSELPELKDEFNLGIIGEAHAHKRLCYHKKYFRIIIDIFFNINSFKNNISIMTYKDNILFLSAIRNLLSHGDISYHRGNILFVPKDERASKKFNEIVKPNNSEYNDGTVVLDLDNDEVYNSIIQILIELDEVFLKNIAESFGVEYFKIK